MELAASELTASGGAMGLVDSGEPSAPAEHLDQTLTLRKSIEQSDEIVGGGEQVVFRVISRYLFSVMEREQDQAESLSPGHLVSRFMGDNRPRIYGLL